MHARYNGATYTDNGKVIMSEQSRNISKTEKEELLHQMEDKAREFYQSQHSLVNLIQETLKNFGYRYFESPTFSSYGVNLVGDDDYAYSGVETSLVEALKCSNRESKEKLIEFAKKADIKQEPSVKYTLGTKILSLSSSGQGEVEAYSEINWDYPKFRAKEGSSILKVKVFSFDDPLIFRNQYALFLEDVSTIF